MYLRLQYMLERARESFWAIPAIMVVAALAAAVISLEIDYAAAGSIVLPGWLPMSSVDGARATLSTISGSIMTVASIVFSLTFVAATQVSTQLGPRNLLTLMRDQVVKIVLGLFLATFVFSFVVQGTVDAGEQRGFVPVLSMYLASLLVLVSFLAIIYFIHHVANIIQADTVISRLGRQLNGAIHRHFKHDAEVSDYVDGHEVEQRRDAYSVRDQAVGMVRGGYVVNVDEEWLLQLAEEQDLLVDIVARPGQFLAKDARILSVSGGQQIDEELRSQLGDGIIIGQRRSPDNHVEFEINALTEIGLRALSPGINDPFTALTVIDRLGDGFRTMLEIREGVRVLRGKDDIMRVVAWREPFAHFLDAAFHPLRRYARGDAMVMVSLLQALSQLAELADHPNQIDVIREHIDAIEEDCTTGTMNTVDRRRLSKEIERTRRYLPLEPGGITLPTNSDDRR